MSARLYIPRALPISIGLLGGVMALAGARAALARMALIADTRGGLEFLFVSGLGFAVVGSLIGVMMVVTAVRWTFLRVDVTEAGAAVRQIVRRTSVPSHELKGVVLRQDGGTPQLRIVRVDGSVLVVPGWSLRARWSDGEVDDAGPALEQLAAEHGFSVKVLRLLGKNPGDR